MNKFEYFEKARELGRMILASEESIALADARANLDNDHLALKQMEEFAQYQDALQQAVNSGHMDTNEYAQASSKLSDMRKEMLELDSAKEYIKAQEEYEAFAQSVIDVLEMMIKGDVENDKDARHGCGKHGNCSGCGAR